MKVAVVLNLSFLFLWILGPDISFCEVKLLDPRNLRAFTRQYKLGVVLFKSADECPCCNKALEYLDRAPQPDTIQTVIEKRYITDEDLAEKYMATDYPVIIFFRHEYPVLYKGKLQSSDDLMDFVDWLERASEIAVTMLHDSTFEHLTQAATGATTGDWLVLFSSLYAPSFSKVYPSFESTALDFKHRMNFALVDSEPNENLIERFQVQKIPHIILFKQGKMYRYEPEKFDILSMTAFLEGWYRNVKAEDVPKEPTAFDKLTESIALYIKERMDDPNRRWIIMLGGVLSFVGVSFILYLVCCYKAQESRNKAD